MHDELVAPAFSWGQYRSRLDRLDHALAVGRSTSGKAGRDAGNGELSRRNRTDPSLNRANTTRGMRARDDGTVSARFALQSFFGRALFGSGASEALPWQRSWVRSQ